MSGSVLQSVTLYALRADSLKSCGAFLFLVSRIFSNFLVSDSVVDLETADLKY